jgi:hypothetical protein
MATAVRSDHDGNLALAERRADALGVDAGDAGPGVGRIRLDAHLSAGEAPGSRPQLLDSQRQQPDAHLLPGRQDHVQLALVGARGHLLGQPDQPVRLARHGGDDDHDLVTGRPGLADPPRHVLDPLHIAHGRPAVLLHDQRHRAPRLSRRRAASLA